MTDPFATTMDTNPSAETDGSRTVIGERYEIHGLIGAGGMGNVYRARDRELDEIVAVKVLRQELIDAPGALERFRREVKLARRVTHPNVARVFDIGARGAERILTMELIDGESLGKLIERQGALPVSRAVEIAMAIARGVGAAHEAGVVHRDLKPDNVLLSTTGRVVVSDFGIARAAAAVGAERTAGGIVGSPSYMAPEQVEGRADLDHRADIYAFGAMLFEMLTGRPPWRGDSVIAIAAARLLHPPPDPRELMPDLDAAVAEITLRCMAREPGARFESMALVCDHLAANVRPAEPPARAAPEPVIRARHASDKRVAVLAFKNLGTVEQAYVADALTDDLIDLLSMARGLHVQSRGMVMRHRGEERDARELGRELGVQVVVDGAVRPTAGAFRISARLISVADGFQIWARRFEGADPLKLNDEVARAVADALIVGIDSPERESGDAETVDLYLRARALNNRFVSGDAAGSIALFERALARSPSDPRIVAGYVMSRARSPLTAGPDLRALRDEAERAVRLAPSLADAHVALGAVLAHSCEESAAMRPLCRALRLTPNSADAHDFLGRLLSEADRDEGRAHLEACLALEPGFEFARSALARYHALRGDFESAASVNHRDTALPLDARFALWSGDVERAREVLSRIPKENDPKRPVIAVVRALAEAAALGKATKLGATDELKPRVRAFLLQVTAETHAAVGDRAGAMTAIQAAVALGLIDVSWMDRCPALAAARTDPAFAAARETVAARAERVVAEYLAEQG